MARRNSREREHGEGTRAARTPSVPHSRSRCRVPRESIITYPGRNHASCQASAAEEEHLREKNSIEESTQAGRAAPLPSRSSGRSREPASASRRRRREGTGTHPSPAAGPPACDEAAVGLARSCGDSVRPMRWIRFRAARSCETTSLPRRRMSLPPWARREGDRLWGVAPAPPADSDSHAQVTPCRKVGIPPSRERSAADKLSCTQPVFLSSRDGSA